MTLTTYTGKISLKKAIKRYEKKFLIFGSPLIEKPEIEEVVHSMRTVFME